MQNLILECAVRASLIAICTGAVLFILRVKTARVRHAVWASVVALMLALPVWTAWGPKAVVRTLKPATEPTSTTLTEAFSGQALAVVSGAGIRKPPVPRLSWTWQNWLAGVYFLGFCALLARLATGTVRAHMLVRRAANRGGRLTSDSCAVPVTVGGFHPTVILPECWRRWPREQLNAVLAHEDEHARRRDPLVQWLALLNRAVFWFHPLAWWLEFRLSALAEEACDAAVLAGGHNPVKYSEYLLEIARAMQKSGARVKVLGMAMPGACLPRRIRRILEGAPERPISGTRMASVAVACAVVSTVFTAGAVGYAPVPTDGPAAITSPIARLTAIEPASPDLPHNLARKHAKVLLAQAEVNPASPNPSEAASAPQDGGPISGTVEDPSGARVPNCDITIRDQSGVGIQTMRSDASGSYTFVSIPPGRYTVEYAMPGFARLKMRTEIAAGKPVRIDAKLSLGWISESVEVTAPKPAIPAPAVQPAAASGPISIGGRVEATRLLQHIGPIYPSELQQQGVEGTVMIEAIISRDGVPIDSRVINSGEIDPRFAQAALDAVSQWRYEPAKLNGQPVPVITKIDIQFQLGK